MRIVKSGLTHLNTTKATLGFTLIAPNFLPFVSLIDLHGEEVHRWDLKSANGCATSQLLENGNLLVCEESEEVVGVPHGRGGCMREYDWDSNLVWEYIDHSQHHDVRRLPNGNTLYLGWELMTGELAERVQGGELGTEDQAGGIWSDYLREVTPDGGTVWEWHLWDENIENYPLPVAMNRAELAHINTCYPLANGDVLISMQRHSTISIVDRKTQRIRWEYRNRDFGRQHDVQELDNGNYMLFANGLDSGSALHASTVMEFNPDTKILAWQYKSDRPLEFYSPHISGCQRLTSGNTLVCEGVWGRTFEVTSNGELVWEYINPHEHRHELYGLTNWLYRSYRYERNSTQIQNRL